MTKEEAFNIGLPKWPQCVINGEKITEEQALEIIRRTDRFFGRLGGGNNHEFDEKARKICRKPDIEDFKDGNEFNEAWAKYIEAREEFVSKWQLIDTEYIHNSWISCPWIGGYHGWCHPDGTIAFCNNIGKWPEVEDVYKDLCILGEHFPFLNLTCTLMNGEEDFATESLVTMKLENGEVSFIDTIPFKDLKFNGIKPIFRMNRNRENYFSLTQIQKMADQVYNK